MNFIQHVSIKTSIPIVFVGQFMDGLQELTKRVHVHQHSQSRITEYRQMTPKEFIHNNVKDKQTVNVQVRTSSKERWKEVEAKVEAYLWVKRTHQIKKNAFHTGVLARVAIGHGGNSEEHFIVVLDSENPVDSPIRIVQNRRWKDFKVPQV